MTAGFLNCPQKKPMDPDNKKIADIIRLVCKHFCITQKDLFSKSRRKSIAHPRQIGVYLSRKYTDLPLMEIGRRFNRNHGTILHSIDAVEKGMQANNITRYQVEYLANMIK